ncbi:MULTISPECIES: thioredoxin domain-containing protein [unclassified Arthrobacter]|uniref:thioredoxin domain-containing protein n=1 Tax=Pseudarthrobacter sp. S6 TaxID=3418420 RepID=UPI003396162D
MRWRAPWAPRPAAHQAAPLPARPPSAKSPQRSFTTYTPEAVSSASESEKVILFFHATWCSTCKLLASDIEANAASIPAGVKILKVDYDSETALKQKYGVTLQHTLVQVKPDGSQIAKWSLSRDLNALVKEIR